MPMQTIRLHPGMSYNALVNALNENFAALENFSRTIIIKDNTGASRIVIGYQKDGF